jgi:hypothetical protein
MQRSFSCIDLAITSLSRHRRPDPHQAQGSVPAALKRLKIITSHQSHRLQKTARSGLVSPTRTSWIGTTSTSLTMCRWPTSSGLVNPTRTGGVRRDLAAGRQRPGLVSPAFGEKEASAGNPASFSPNAINQPSGLVYVLSKSQGGDPDFDNTYNMAYGTDPDSCGAGPPYQVWGGRRSDSAAAARLVSRSQGMLAIPGINNSFATGAVDGMTQGRGS